MAHEDAIALVEELGGTAEHVDRMRRILSGLVDEPPITAHTWMLEPAVIDESEEVEEIGAVGEGGQSGESEPPGGGSRYEDLGLLGRGGMGEVRRVRDRELGRTLAMKIASEGVMNQPRSLARFVAEAQATAQLQHPGIIPVHELGRLPDGHAYFTMKEVRGRTLAEVVAEFHATRHTVWTFRRLVDAFLRVCEAVAYAHSRGVVHRDLKPENVMVGAHGEVLVLDWGIAKVTGQPDLAERQGDFAPEAGDWVTTDRSRDGTQMTMMGAIAGTPAYMPPEQANGELDRIDARSDIYALGAILYEVLSGRRPYVGDPWSVLTQVRAGPPVPLGVPGDRLLPGELVAVVERAMARDPSGRFPDASQMGRAVREWLEGARRRDQALSVVAVARRQRDEVEVLGAQARELRSEAAALLARTRPWEDEGRKAEGWAREDAAAEHERRVAQLEMEAERGLHAALRVDPGLVEAHEDLADLRRGEHAAAEERRDDEAILRAVGALREHLGALPVSNAVRVGCLAYLKGDGALTLETDPPGAQVLLHRYILHNRRLVPRFERSLGTTPLRAVTLPMGSYLCVLRHPERVDTRYPVFIGRQEHWDGVPPGATSPSPVPLPRAGELGEGDCYVPAGWFWSGGDPHATNHLPRRRLWAGGLVVRRFPVTNAEYIAFLDDLVDSGREEEALRWVPRERAGGLGEQGAMIYDRDHPVRDHPARGGFVLRPDAQGDWWGPRWPVLMVDWLSAAAFADWQAQRSGAPWRLPGELEWEKAARGVDGRLFPWGDWPDPSWCNVRDSQAAGISPVSVERFSVDTSVYGVRGAAGNSKDWCGDVFSREAGPPVEGARVQEPARREPGDDRERVYRGGSWPNNLNGARIGKRFGDGPSVRFGVLGFRIARSWR